MFWGGFRGLGVGFGLLEVKVRKRLWGSSDLFVISASTGSFPWKQRRSRGFGGVG